MISYMTQRVVLMLAPFALGSLVALAGCGGAGEERTPSDEEAVTGSGAPGGSGQDGGSSPDSGGNASEAVTSPDEGRVGASGVRRLSREEMDNTLRDILGDDTRPAVRFLPEDVLDPFDNDFSTQRVSSVLIEGLETLASDVAARLLADTARRDEVVGCEPESVTDAACMERFVRSFGRRALRRPPTDDEVSEWSALGISFAEGRDDFYEGADVVLRLFLQHPQFVYRVEVGTETEQAGIFRLNDHEVATRLSYFLWGSTPDDALLDAADAGSLSTSSGVKDAARWMLADPRARHRVDRFHAMWLGFHQLPHHADLTQALRLETRALIDDVVFDQGASWLELFRATGTFINDFLADHYGLPRPGTEDLTWVDYGDSGRQGLLSQGSFLSLGAKFADTSPTMRGLAIRTRLLCQTIPPPPPDIDTDNPPGEDEPGACKVDRYAQHRENGACNGCHSLMDPIGFGLENYNAAGQFRSHEVGNPDCQIDGIGAVDDAPFRGPSELADLLVQGDTLDACVVRQVYRFAMGHEVLAADQAVVVDLTQAFRDQDHRFDALIVGLTADPAFLFRKESEE